MPIVGAVKNWAIGLYLWNPSFNTVAIIVPLLQELIDAERQTVDTRECSYLVELGYL
jgi:hypothetical protein